MPSQHTALIVAAFVCALVPAACSAQRNKSNGALSLAQIRALKQKVVPLHKPLGEPQPGEWLAEHKEAGQTFDQYLRRGPRRPPAGGA